MLKQYQNTGKPFILCVYDYEDWILGTWAKEIKNLYSDTHIIINVSMFTEKRKLLSKLVKMADAVFLLLPHAFDLIYDMKPKIIITAVHHWVNYSDFFDNPIQHSNYIVTPSNEWYKKILDKNKKGEFIKTENADITVIHSGYSHFFNKSYNRSFLHKKDKFSIGFFAKKDSNEYDRKGTKNFMNIIKMLNPNYYRLIITGFGWDEFVKEIIDMNFEVKYYKHLKTEIMNEMYQNIDIYLILSNIEGGPATIPEAMISGCILLTTKVGLALDIIKDGENGFFIDNKNEIEIIKLLELLRTNTQLCNQISYNAYLYAKDNLSYANTFINLKYLFDKIPNFHNSNYDTINRIGKKINKFSIKVNFSENKKQINSLLSFFRYLRIKLYENIRYYL